MVCTSVWLGGCSAPEPKPDWNSLWPSVGGKLPAEVLSYPGPQLATLGFPGAQNAIAWLPSGAFWTGDFELAVLDADGTPVEFRHKEIFEPGVFIYRSVAERRPVRIEAIALAPWRIDQSDSLAWGGVQLELKNQGNRPTGIDLAIQVRSGGGKNHVPHPQAPHDSSFSYTERSGRVYRNQRLIAVLPDDWESSLDKVATTAQTHRYDRKVVVATRQIDLDVGETRRFGLWLAPVAWNRNDPPEWLKRSSLPVLAEETKLNWETLLTQGARFEFGDPSAQRAFDAAVATLHLCFERSRGEISALGNPFQYRDMYLRDGARLVRALNLLGAHDRAAITLRQMFSFQWPRGVFLSQRGQLDGTGQVLWSLDQHVALSGNTEIAKTYFVSALRGAGWIQRMRSYTTLRGGPAAGLLPFSDPRDNELLPGHLLGSDAWALAGIRALAGLCRKIDRGDDADRLTREAKTYTEVLHAKWQEASRRQARPLPPVYEAGGRDWGNLAAVYPLGIYQANDSRAVELDRWIRRERFSQGLPYYGSPDSLHHYLGFDLTQSALRRGDREQVGEDLGAVLRHTQPDGTGFEILHARDREFALNLPPHGTFAAMLVDLLRCCLLYEKGDSLVLLAGVPDSMFTGPSRFGVEDAPSRLGRVSFWVTASEAHTLELEGSFPAPVQVSFPDDLSIKEIEGSPSRTGSYARSLHLAPGTGKWIIHLAKQSRL